MAIDPIHWFLNDTADPRCRSHLMAAATEREIQGLELDWICMTWDADLRMRGQQWRHHSFKGAKWQNINTRTLQQYHLNAYRVLLTRARQGMIIFVPSGDSADPTREPGFYDETFEYLAGMGIREV